MRTPTDCIHALNSCAKVGNPERWTLALDEKVAKDIIAHLVNYEDMMVDHLRTHNENVDRTLALKMLVDQVELCGKESAGIFQIAAIHGCEYRGPNWVKELEAAKAALNN